MRKRNARNAPAFLLLHKRFITGIQAPDIAIDRPGGTLLPIAIRPSMGLLRFGTELEYVHGVMRRADGEQAADDVEVDGVDPGLPRAAAELIQLLGAGDAPHANDSALV